MVYSLGVSLIEFCVVGVWVCKCACEHVHVLLVSFVSKKVCLQRHMQFSLNVTTIYSFPANSNYTDKAKRQSERKKRKAEQRNRANNSPKQVVMSYSRVFIATCLQNKIRSHHKFELWVHTNYIWSIIVNLDSIYFKLLLILCACIFLLSLCCYLFNSNKMIKSRDPI